MADPDTKPKPNAFEQMFSRPLVEAPEGEDGMGSTLGEDVSAGHERDTDARHGVHAEDADQKKES